MKASRTRFCYVTALVLIGCADASPPRANSNGQRQTKATSAEAATATDRNPANRLGTVYTRFYPDRDVTLESRWIDIPDFPGTHAIWGGTGRDDQGNIYLGVCTVWTPQAPQPSARVYQLKKTDSPLQLTGDVIGSLKKAGSERQVELTLSSQGRIVTKGEAGKPTLCRESQMKIHSKFVAMDDGWLYFASMDEWNEREDGSQLPYWGSHLWRYRDGRWENLATVPEGLIAVSGVGRYVFALGYFGHVVYCYDTHTGRLTSTVIGSFNGHISRNFLSNAAGHVFVPRIAQEDPQPGNVSPESDHVAHRVELVELDHELNEVQVSPIRHYRVTGGSDSHGITGVAYLADGSMVFTTSEGSLYQIVPREDAPSQVREVGWFHPDGQAYCPSLFAVDGKRWLCGVTSQTGKPGYEWVIYDLESVTSTARPFTVPREAAFGLKSTLLYGSNTRDDAGNFYLVGCYRTTNPSRQLPLCLQVSMAQGERPADVPAEH